MIVRVTMQSGRSFDHVVPDLAAAQQVSDWIGEMQRRRDPIVGINSAAGQQSVIVSSLMQGLADAAEEDTREKAAASVAAIGDRVQGNLHLAQLLGPAGEPPAPFLFEQATRLPGWLMPEAALRVDFVQVLADPE